MGKHLARSAASRSATRNATCSSAAKTFEPPRRSEAVFTGAKRLLRLLDRTEALLSRRKCVVVAADEAVALCNSGGTFVGVRDRRPVDQLPLFGRVLSATG